MGLSAVTSLGTALCFWVVDSKKAPSPEARNCLRLLLCLSPIAVLVLFFAVCAISSQNFAGVGGSFAFVFVFAVRIHVDALAHPGVEAFSPLGQLFRRVVFQPQTHISEVRGQHFWRFLLLRLRNAQRGLVLAKGLIRFFGVPRRVAYLERKQKSRRP